MNPMELIRSLPQRPLQHQVEAAAHKLLEIKLPDSWILRMMTERDYGNDYLLEIVNEEGLLTGQFAWIQLKARKKINWDSSGRFRLGNVKKSTTNYWRVNSAPVFIFLADLELKEVYFLCTEYFIRRNFSTYLNKGSFAYYFNRSQDRFDCPNGKESFCLHLEKQETRRHFESELTIFLTNLENYQNCLVKLPTRDHSYESDHVELYHLTTLQRNFNFLCDYFHLKRLSTTFQKLLNHNNHHSGINLYNLQKEYSEKEREILFCIRNLLNEELAYWSFTNPEMYYYVYALTKSAITLNLSNS